MVARTIREKWTKRESKKERKKTCYVIKESKIAALHIGFFVKKFKNHSRRVAMIVQKRKI